jgi:hypothetical protein
MCVGFCSICDGENRKMENICRGLTYGDFVTIFTEGSMQDNTVARPRECKSTDSPLTLH